MIILIDCDGIVADCVTTAGLSHKTITSYDNPAIIAALTRPNFALDMFEYEGARQGIYDLVEAGHNVVFVTAPYPENDTWAHDREIWLEERFPGFPVVHTKHKYLIDGDVFIDDSPANVQRWQDCHQDGYAVLWARPWNREVTDAWCRTNSWTKLYRMIEVINEQR